MIPSIATTSFSSLIFEYIVAQRASINRVGFTGLEFMARICATGISACDDFSRGDLLLVCDALRMESMEYGCLNGDMAEWERED